MNYHDNLLSRLTLSFLLTISWIGLAKSAEIKPFMKSEVNLISQTAPMNLKELESSSWQLISYQNAQGIPSLPYSQHEPTLQLQDGRISGTTGCNRYLGSYQMKTEGISLKPSASTLMACVFEGLSQQEQAYLKALAEVTQYELKNGQLLLFNEQKKPILVFEKIRPASLTGNLWQLQQYNNGRGGITSLVRETTVNMRLTETGDVYGLAGCNSYRGQWEKNEGNLQFSPLASTRKLCQQPEGVMSQESAFLALFDKVKDYEIDGKTLVLRDEEGTKLAQFKAIIALQE
ncbi:MAG: META domain-containing protein [Microcystaceae cyanobacterium]